MQPFSGKKDRQKNEDRKADRRYLAVSLFCLVAVVLVTAAVFLYALAGYGRVVSVFRTGWETVSKDDNFPHKEFNRLIERGGKDNMQAVRTDQNSGKYALITSCRILDGGEELEVAAVADNKPFSDDDRFYLFELETYEDVLEEDAVPIASTKKAEQFTLSAAVLKDTADSRLYSKFLIGVKLNGNYRAISTPWYITNPEALAPYQDAYPEAASIKGLLVDPLKLATTELDDLGVKQAAYNIPIARFLGPSTSSNYPTITYHYKGKNYQINGHVVSEYDYVFKTLTDKGILITAILLNNKTETYPQLIHPLSRNGTGHYYAFNAAEEEGCEYLEAIAAFLASRYRDTEHGIVMNWIVGNEVNVRSDWNYMQYVDLNLYAREYARAVRLFYNGIKSENANARIYISLDQQWNRNLTSDSSYDSRDLLDAYNACIAAEGNIYWGMAHHPYSVPITWPKFWQLSEQNDDLVQESADTSMITIKNIDVLTDYLQREELLMPDGNVRSVILSEMGFTSTYGEDVQAAAFTYAYYISEKNQHIDALILSRETDAAEEVAQGLALGISYQNGRKKYIYNTYKYIDTERAAEYTDFAKVYLGIKDWSEVISSY